MSRLKIKQLAFSSKYNVDIYEFQYGINRRKPRSDRGRRRGKYKQKIGQAKETATNVAKYGGALIAGDQIFSAGQKLGGGAIKGAAKSMGYKGAFPKANPKSVIGRGKRVAKYAAGLAIGDMALRGVNKLGGTALENRHKLKDRAKEIRDRKR
jgi:hypothetical protein